MDQLHPEEVLNILQKPTLPPEFIPTDVSRIPPTLGEAISAMAQTGPDTLLRQATERGIYSDAPGMDRFVYNAMRATTPSAFMPNTPPEGRMLDPAEANAAFAPKGEDWFSKPISEGLAQITARQKLENLQRDSDIARWEDSSNIITNFAMGTAASLLDPLNVGAAMVPGVGAEAVSARLGGGMVARMAGRAVAGASGGAIAALPNVGIHEALDPNYTLYDAFSDLSMSAAAGALIQGVGEGGLREAGVLSPDALMREAQKIVPSAVQNHAAIQTAVGQIVEGAPVEVTPIIHPPPTDLQVRNIRTYIAANRIEGVSEETIQKAASLLPIGVARTRDDLEAALREAQKITLTPTLADLAAKTKTQVEEGFAPGMSREEFRAAKQETEEAAEAKPSEPVKAVPMESETKPEAAPQETTPAEKPQTRVLSQEEIDKTLASPELQTALADHSKIDRTHDTPYLAGASTESGVTHIDPRVPKELGLEGLHEESVVIDPAGPLHVHEQVEHALMEQGMAYEVAHRIALKHEQAAVESGGWWGPAATWASYQDAMHKLAGITEKETPTNPATDLYMKPYEEEDPHEASKIREAQGAPSIETPSEPLDPEIAQAQAQMDQAQALSDAYAQAAQCLIEGGL